MKTRIEKVEPLADDEVLLEAEFNPKVCTYWLLSGAIVFVVCVVTIPLLPIWFIAGQAVTRRYLSRMRCRLTTRSLKVERGYFVRVEKTVPLDKITDLALVQGPIMRHFDIEAISVETAGQSGPGALLRLTGIVNGRAFRDAVLARRDEVVATSGEARPEGSPAPSAPLQSDTAALLREIRDEVSRIANHLERDRGQ